MSNITMIMYCKERLIQHVVPIFVRENSSFTRYVNWDDIQNLVADGHTITIRPPTAEEEKSFKP